MANDSTNTTPGPQTPAFAIDLLSQIDSDYWCQIFHVTAAQLREAVQSAGPQAVDVSRYLRSKGYMGTA